MIAGLAYGQEFALMVSVSLELPTLYERLFGGFHVLGPYWVRIGSAWVHFGSADADLTNSWQLRLRSSILSGCA